MSKAKSKILLPDWFSVIVRPGCSSRPPETQPTFPFVAFSLRPPRPLREAFLLHPVYKTNLARRALETQSPVYPSLSVASLASFARGLV
jgi:hypothetical protein